MKKSIFLALLLGLLYAPQAHALNCEVSQAIGGPDSCFTRVMLSSAETQIVSTGHVLVYDIDGASPPQGGYQVRMPRTSATASVETGIVAGFAQGPIRSGDSAMIQVRGFGLVRTVGGVATGDTLFVAASGNVASTGHNIGVGNIDAANFASLNPVAIALQTASTNGTTTRFAWIKIL